MFDIFGMLDMLDILDMRLTMNNTNKQLWRHLVWWGRHLVWWDRRFYFWLPFAFGWRSRLALAFNFGCRSHLVFTFGWRSRLTFTFGCRSFFAVRDLLVYPVAVRFWLPYSGQRQRDVTPHLHKPPHTRRHKSMVCGEMNTPSPWVYDIVPQNNRSMCESGMSSVFLGGVGAPEGGLGSEPSRVCPYTNGVYKHQQ